MVHTGDALAGIGVADPRVEIKFKDAAGKTTNGDTEPTTLISSAWDKVMGKVGSDYGWHIFAMAIMDCHHSVTLFVDNQPEGKTLYWADQWRIDRGDDFFQLPGAISGFRQYEKEGSTSSSRRRLTGGGTMCIGRTRSVARRRGVSGTPGVATAPR